MKYQIPEAALQQNIAVLGKNGSGKTYAAKAVIVEPLLADGRRVGIVDPTGAWWGLRTSSDGKGGGFKILVLGGDHGDLPLPPNGGAAVARLLAVQGVNLVADTSQMTVGERTRWFTEFAGTLYRANKSPLHLILDEAHNFAPQGKVPDPDAGKMLHAASTLASQGRSRGIRLTMITQRPQKLHKDSLTSAETLIAMRVIHPLDRGAVADWINGCADPVKGKEVLDSLAGLKTGEGRTWHPGESFLHRMKFPAIKTFDSSATPMDGESAADPKGAAEIDLTEIKTALADAVKEAEANDPKLLRKRIAELEKAAGRPQAAAVDNQLLKNYRDEGYRDGVLAGRAEALTGVVKVLKDTREHLTAALSNVDAVTHETGMAQIKALPSEPSRPAPRPTIEPLPTRAKSAITHSGSPDIHLPTGERAILTACAQYDDGCTREQLSVLTGYKRSSRDTYIQRLREKWYAAGTGHSVVATEAGVAALGPDFEPLPTGDALQQYWFSRLPDGERKILKEVVARYPDPVDREKLDELTGYRRSSRDTYIQRLRARQLVTAEGRGAVRASDDLFD